MDIQTDYALRIIYRHYFQCKNHIGTVIQLKLQQTTSQRIMYDYLVCHTLGTSVTEVCISHLRSAYPV